MSVKPLAPRGSEPTFHERSDKTGSLSTYDAQLKLARRIATLPKNEQSAYWKERERKLIIARDKRRKPAKITLPKI